MFRRWLALLTYPLDLHQGIHRTFFHRKKAIKSAGCLSSYSEKKRCEFTRCKFGLAFENGYHTFSKNGITSVLDVTTGRKAVHHLGGSQYTARAAQP
jgi:hypothetical protein